MRIHRVAGAATGLIVGLTMSTLLTMLTACGSTSSKPPSTTAAPTTTLDPVAAQSAIEAAWAGFFNGKSPLDARLAYLEDATALRPVIVAQASLSGGVTAKAKKADLFYGDSCTGNGVVSPCAVVTYDLLVNGTAGLSDATGYAVYVNGQWLVSKTTICALYSLTGGKTPTQCA